MRNRLKRIFKSKSAPLENRGISFDDPRIGEIFGYRDNISGTGSLTVPAILQAIRLISETIGSLPVKLYHEGDEGKLAAKNHPAYRIAHRFGNEWQPSHEQRTLITADALIYGSGFALVIRDPETRQPFGLDRIAPDRVQILQDSITGAPVYRVSENHGKTDYHFSDILHIQSFTGRSPVSLGKEAISLSATLEKHATQLFEGGARPPLTFTRTRPLPSNSPGEGETTIRNMRESYRQAQKDGFKTPLFLDGNWSVNQFALTSTDAQFLENRTFQIDDIARIFGIPPTLLFELTRGTWANTEEMHRTFLQLCLRPWLDKWQSAYARCLLNESEQNDHYFEFVIDDLQRADTQTRAEVFNKLVAARVMTPNEVRSAMNLPPLPGGDELANPYTTATPTPNEGTDHE